MSEMGHSRPMHLVPVPINVRCYSNSNPIVRRSELTLRARNGLQSPLQNLYLQFSIHFGKQLCQIADLDILKRPHGALDVTAQLRADMACRELVELGADLLPAEWPRRKSRIIRYLVAERLTAFKPHGYPARELGRKTGREALVWFHADLKEKALDVRLRNSFGVELCRLNIAIKQGNRQQVGKAMIGVFLGMDVGLWTEASTASEVISVLDHIGFDAHDLGGIKWVDLV